MRKPNTICCICAKPIYRRPGQMEANPNGYCSQDCFYSLEASHGRKRVVERSCENCGKTFLPSENKARFCGKSCANSVRIGMRYGKGRTTAQRKAKLIELAGSDRCMVRGCEYDRTVDVHRFIPGKEGGEYAIGNMFLVCPNHHAEVTRGLTKLRKLNHTELEVLT